MPERADRLYQLQLHGIQQRHRPPDLAAALRRNARRQPPWPTCHCGYPIDPATGEQGHPSCERSR